MVIPSPPPGSQPIAGSYGVDLLDNNLTQWASYMQEVTLHMRWPPEAAVSCPQSDIIGVLDRLECNTADTVLESARGVSALQSLAKFLTRWRLCGRHPQ